MRVKLYSDSNRPSDIRRVTDLLERGELIIFPSDLRYVIGCDALKNQAVEKLYGIKGVAESRNKLTLLCSSLSQVSEYARVDNKVFRLLKKNMPGPFTFILPGLNKLPKVFDKRKEVGVRIPQNPIVIQIIKALGHPLMVSSLPVPEYEDEEDFLDPELTEERFGDGVALVIDGGRGENGVTTVVDCTGDEPEVERQGIGILYT